MRRASSIPISTGESEFEYSLGANPLLHELVPEKFPMVDGQVEIPDRPGLGITVDEDFRPPPRARVRALTAPRRPCTGASDISAREVQ